MVHFEAWRGVWFGCGVEFEVASEEMSLETRAGPRLSGAHRAWEGVWIMPQGHWEASGVLTSVVT